MSFDPTSMDIANLEVAEPTGYLPDDGAHYGYASKLTSKKSNAGNWMVVAEITTIDPGHNQKVLKYNYFTLTEKAIWRFKQFALAVNPDMKPGLDATSDQSLQDNLWGLPFKFVTTQYESEYNGKTTTKVDLSEYEALTAADVKILTAAYGQTLVPEPTQDANSSASGSAAADDCPF